jgi:hypothetical protein
MMTTITELLQLGADGMDVVMRVNDGEAVEELLIGKGVRFRDLDKEMEMGGHD